MIRHPKKYSIDEVFAFVRQHIDLETAIITGTRKYRQRFDFDGDMMKPWSLRYFTFILKGTKCATCGVQATHFYKEKNLPDDRYHFNLYGIDAKGEEVLFTKDHHNPRSNDGKDEMDNFVTMCTVCNMEKGSTLPE